LRLRSKFMLSFALLTAGLTCATLLTVRRNAESRVRLEVKQEAFNAILTFQALENHHQVALSRKADLLASLALMRNGEATALKEVAEDPWQSEECDLLALADPHGKILAVHAMTGRFPTPEAQEMMTLSLSEGKHIGWWYSGSRLYQVVLQPFYEDQARKKNLVGTVIVGHGIDPSANELRRITSSQMAFQYGEEVVASTLAPLKTEEFARQLKTGSLEEQVKVDGERFYTSSVELSGGARPVRIIVLKSYDESLAYLAHENRMLAGLGLLAVLAGGVLVFLISDKFTRPLSSLLEGVRALENGNFEYPLNSNGTDEVAQVTHAFGRMRGTLKANETEQQQLQDQLRKSQRMEAIGRLAGGVAHDFNNLLTVIKGHGDLMLDRLEPNSALYGNARQIEKASNRAASLTRQLLAFSRMQMLQPKVLNLNSLVSEMFSILKRLVREDITFTFRAGESLGRIKADPGQIEQVIMNLAVNASDAMPSGGSLTVETQNLFANEALCKTRTSLVPGNYVRLVVADTGHGMDAETMARIFEPFFTTKELGKGTGLGLATVYGVVKQSGGCIWVDSAPGKGTRFEVYFPAVQESEEQPAEEADRHLRSGHSEVVLLVEDEDQVRDLAAEFIESAGYAVLTARDGQDALRVAEQSGKRIRVLVTDIVMPNMRGPELAKRLNQRCDGLRVIYMSGYLEFNNGSDFLKDMFFLQKPFSRDSLVAKIADALGKEREHNSHPLALVNS
jgi:signal transduction histidine kinase/ActR/RegA family two-component response regulator